jgi:hypothetical protein
VSLRVANSKDGSYGLQSQGWQVWGDLTLDGASPGVYKPRDGKAMNFESAPSGGEKAWVEEA